MSSVNSTVDPTPGLATTALGPLLDKVSQAFSRLFFEGKDRDLWGITDKPDDAFADNFCAPFSVRAAKLIYLSVVIQVVAPLFDLEPELTCSA